jgi:hypothetical protein
MGKIKFIKKKIINFKSTILILSLCILIIPFSSIFAASVYGLNQSATEMAKVAEWAGFNTTQEDPEPIIGQVIKALISFLGVVFFILIVYGGFLWMTAGGSPDKVDKAKKIIMNATIGLVLVMFAYAITWYIVFQITDATSYDAG